MRSLALREALLGARDTIPLLVGVTPFGIIYGTLAVGAGLSLEATMLMSLLVFAGASQLIAAGLLASGSGIWVILLTTFVVNLRHMLYSASLLPYVRHLPRRWRLPLGFWLTDESFAVVYRRYLDERLPLASKHWYFLGSCIAMYSTWNITSLLGALLGHAVPQMADWGLDFAMVVTFLGIVVPALRNWPMLLAALSAALIALLAHDLPWQLGLILAALGGVAAGVMAEQRLHRANTRSEVNDEQL